MHEICQRRKLQQQKNEKAISESGEKLLCLMENDLAEERDMVKRK